MAYIFFLPSKRLKQRYLVTLHRNKKNILMKKKITEAAILLCHIGAVTLIYWGACKMLGRNFGELELLYSVAIGCVAYIPRMASRLRRRR